MHKISLFFLLFCLFSSVAEAADAPINRQQLMREFTYLDSLYDANENQDMKEDLRICLEEERIAKVLQMDSLQLVAIIKKAEALNLLGFMDLSLKESYNALALAQKRGNLSYQQKCLAEIARTFQSLEDYVKSLDYFIKAKVIAIRNKSYADTLICNYEIAFNYIALGKEEEGLEMMKHNVQVAKETQDYHAIMMGLDNLANISAELEENEMALKYELELLNYREHWGSNYYKTGIYDHFAEIYIKLKRWKEAQQYLDSTFKYAQLIRSNDWLFECYKSQAIIDEQNGNYKKALENHKQYLLLKDSVYQANYDVKMASMASYHDLETKQNQISILEKDNDLQKSQRNAIVLIALLALGAVASYFVWKHQKEKQKMQLLFSQQLLQSQENEKRRISQELHDSIGQNILFIKNQLNKNNTENQLSSIIETVDTTIEEVRNIAKDLYPNQLEKYGLAAAVETLGEKVSESSGVFISADFQETESFLSKEATIHVYRIIQESINNALKHASASAIRITAELQNGKIFYLIQDNGKGFDKSILVHKQQRSFGLLGMEERVKMLGGHFEVESKAGAGTKLSFSIPNV